MSEDTKSDTPAAQPAPLTEWQKVFLKPLRRLALDMREATVRLSKSYTEKHGDNYTAAGRVEFAWESGKWNAVADALMNSATEDKVMCVMFLRRYSNGLRSAATKLDELAREINDIPTPEGEQ